MASAKPQPLHNFTLPQLKWNKDGGHSGGGGGATSHQRRRSIKSPSPARHADSVSSPSQRHQSPLPDHAPARESQSSSSSKKKHKAKNPPPIGGDPGRHLGRHDSGSKSKSKSEAAAAKGKGKGKSEGGLIEYKRSHSKSLAVDGERNAVQGTASERSSPKLEAKSKGKEVDVGGIRKKSKILLKIPCKERKIVEENPREEPRKAEEPSKNVADDQAGQALEEGRIIYSIEEEGKVWNLRPRKPIKKKQQNGNGGGATRTSGQAVVEKSKAESPLKNPAGKSGENKGNGGGGGGEKKEKRKLSVFVSLTKEEIEEDIFSLTGSKPSRRPKKRAKNVQKQLDAVFPGLWLVSVNADTYKVSESSMKG